jgi:hypothetical protein
MRALIVTLVGIGVSGALLARAFALQGRGGWREAGEDGSTQELRRPGGKGAFLTVGMPRKGRPYVHPIQAPDGEAC